MSTGKRNKTVLTLVAVAMFALAIGQVQAESIEINGDFKMYKPGTNYTVLATTDAGNFWTIGIGDNLDVRNNVIVDYDDGTTGTVVDCPGWITPITLPLWRGGADVTTGVAQLFQLSPVPDGTSCLNAFTGWSSNNGTLAESAESLGNIQAGATYTISAEVSPWGDATSGPVTLQLMAGGVIITPSSEVTPAQGAGTTWEVFSRTYDHTAVAAHAGQPLTIRVGTTPPRDGEPALYGRRIQVDNITLDVEGLMYPSPEDGDIVYADENLELSWTNLPGGDSNDVYVDVWFGTEPNLMHPFPDFDLVLDEGENVTSVLVDAFEPGTYYWQVNSYINGADKINDANMIEGSLWVFHATDDMAPTVEIVTLDMITWSGQEVQLDATVVDDGVSALTYAWSADPAEGIVFSDAGAEDPTVTLTKEPYIYYSEAKIANPSFEMVTSQSAITTSRDTWGHYDRPPGSGYALQYVPNTTFHFPDGDDQVPDGNIICRTATAIGESRPDGLATILDEKFDPSANYTLTVAVGHPHAVPDDPAYNDDTWRGYLVQLVAGGEVESTGSGADNISGGTVIAEDANSVTIAPRTWETSTVTYTPSAEFAALAGQPLQIRLLAVDDPDPAYFSQTKVFYDNVVLTADPPFSAPTGVKTVTLTLGVNDEYNTTPVEDTLTIDLYDDACQAAVVGMSLDADNPIDYNKDCIVNLGDAAVMASKWAVDNSLTEPIAK